MMLHNWTLQVRSHTSLALLGLASTSYFTAMIVARKSLEADELYFWNSLVTIIAVAFSFCFFGAEQLFLRLSAVKNSRVVVSRYVLLLMALAAALFTVVLGMLSEGYFFRLGMPALYPALAFCVSVFVFVYNLMRLQKAFNLAQLAANGWKFAMLVALLLAQLGYVPMVIMSLGLGLSCVGVLLLFWGKRSSLEITKDALPTEWTRLFLSFMISLFVLMMLNNLDRFIMVRLSSQEKFSDYVYIVTLLLLPFSLLSNYVGFKEMAYLKRRYNRRRFLRKTVIVGGVAAGFFMLWFGTIFALQDLLEVTVFLSYAVPGLAIVSCRCSYALLSTLFGLQGRPEQIHIANLLTILAMSIGILGVYVVGVTINSILYLLAALWCVRVVIYAWFSAGIAQYEACYAV